MKKLFLLGLAAFLSSNSSYAEDKCFRFSKNVNLVNLTFGLSQLPGKDAVYMPPQYINGKLNAARKPDALLKFLKDKGKVPFVMNCHGKGYLVPTPEQEKLKVLGACEGADSQATPSGSAYYLTLNFYYESSDSDLLYDDSSEIFYINPLLDPSGKPLPLSQISGFTHAEKITRLTGSRIPDGKEEYTIQAYYNKGNDGKPIKESVGVSDAYARSVYFQAFDDTADNIRLQLSFTGENPNQAYLNGFYAPPTEKLQDYIVEEMAINQKVDLLPNTKESGCYWPQS